MQSRLSIALALVALGCATPEPTPAGGVEGTGGGEAEDSGDPAEPEDTDAPELPLDWTGEVTAAEDLDLADAEAVLQEMVGLARLVHAGPLMATYDEVWSQRVSGCPLTTATHNEGISFTHWYGVDYCDAESGFSLSGQTWHWRGSGVQLTDDRLIAWPTPSFRNDTFAVANYSGSCLLGQYYGQTVEGYDTYGSGSACQLLSEGGEDRHWISKVSGTFVSTSPLAADTWLASGRALDWEVWAHEASSGRHDIIARGGQASMPSTGGSFTSEVLRFSDGSGVGVLCQEEPTGVVYLRDKEGRWGLVELGEDISGCDGCGILENLEGEALGQICADFSEVLAWEGQPW